MLIPSVAVSGVEAGLVTLNIALGLVFRRQPSSFHSPPVEEVEEEGQSRWTVAE